MSISGWDDDDDKVWFVISMIMAVFLIAAAAAVWFAPESQASPAGNYTVTWEQSGDVPPGTTEGVSVVECGPDCLELLFVDMEGAQARQLTPFGTGWRSEERFISDAVACADGSIAGSSTRILIDGEFTGGQIITEPGTNQCPGGGNVIPVTFSLTPA